MCEVVVDSRSSFASSEALAALVQRETGTVINAKMLRLLIKQHWSKIAALAHQIHDRD